MQTLGARWNTPSVLAWFGSGTPILFASVAHGTGHNIAGKGIANPAAMVEAVLRLSKATKSGNRAAA